MFFDLLQKRIDELENPTVVGLDPKFDYLPAKMREEYDGRPAEGVLAFNRAIIDAVADIVPAVKPQLAYYEQFGPAGIRAFADTVIYAKARGLLVIADGKRNDIGSTAAMYARAFFDLYGVDALTVNAYLGSDGVMPFVTGYAERNRGVFALVKTSNPGSGELQDLRLEDGRLVREAVADLIERLNAQYEGEFGPIGAVVGATYPDEAVSLRGRMPRAFFLVPGYGAQGGDASGAVAGFTKSGRGGIVNSSRAIMCAYRRPEYEKYGEDYAAAARAEAIHMRDELRAALAAK